MVDVCWKNTTDGDAIAFNLTCATPATGAAREMTNLVCVDRVWFDSRMRDYVFDNCSFLAGFATLYDGAIYAPEFKNCHIHCPGISNVFPTAENCLYTSPDDVENPHFTSFRGEITAVLYDGGVAERFGAYTSGGDDDVGDLVLPGHPATTQTVTVRNMLVLPDRGGECSAILVSLAGGPGIEVTAENCTSKRYLIAVNEGEASGAGYVADIANCIIWNDGSAAVGDVCHNVMADPADDIVTDAHNNGVNGITTPYRGPASMYAATPGTGDITGDPDFLDRTRDCAAYAVEFFGATGTEAQQQQAFLDALAEKWDSTSEFYQWSISDIIEWIKQGFIPQNPDYRTASDTGGIIGAVDDEIPVVVSDDLPSVFGGELGISIIFEEE
jgi:hypothetical protein